MSDNNIVESKDVILEKKKKGWFKRNWLKLLGLLLLIFFDIFAILGCAIREEYKNIQPNITVPVVSPIKKLQEENGNLIADDYTEGFGDWSYLNADNPSDIISYGDYDRLSDSDKLNHDFYFRWNREYNDKLKLYDYYITIVNTTNTIKSISNLKSFDFQFETIDFSYNDSNYSNLYTFSYYIDGQNHYFNSNLYADTFYYDDFFYANEDAEYSNLLSFNSSFDEFVSYNVLYVNDDHLGSIVFNGWYLDETFDLNPKSSFVFYLCSFSVIPIIQDYNIIYQNSALPNSLTYEEYINLINSNNTLNTSNQNLQNQLDSYKGLTYEQIFNLGKQDGVASVQEGDLNNLIKTTAMIIFNAPYNVLHNVFNFEFLGVNLFSLFSFVITCSIIIYILKLIW